MLVQDLEPTLGLHAGKLQVCIKYANVTIPGVTAAGYHRIGEVTVLEPVVDRLLTTEVFSGKTNVVKVTPITSFPPCCGDASDHRLGTLAWIRC